MFWSLLPLIEIGNNIFFFVSGEGWEILPNENLDEAPRFLHQWGIPVSGVSFYAPLFCFFCNMLITIWLYVFFFFFFLVKTRPHLKSRYKDRLKWVLEYVVEVKDFDDLISPNNLSLHFLGP